MNKLARTAYEAALKQPDVMTKTKDQLAEEAAQAIETYLKSANSIELFGFLNAVIMSAIERDRLQWMVDTHNSSLSQPSVESPSREQTDVAPDGRLIRAGYVIAMRLLQSECSLDDEEKTAISFFVPVPDARQ